MNIEPSIEDINGTLIWYHYICKREVWLIGHGIEANQDNDLMLFGRHIHEVFYKNHKKEFVIDNTIKIDIMSGSRVIGEIKKSSKYLKSSTMQLAFYIYYMKQKGISLSGELIIPEENKRIKVFLTEEIESELNSAIKDIKAILSYEKLPEPEKIQYCNTCAYKEMCWS